MARRSSQIPTSAVDDARATRALWLPLIVIVLAQLQMNMNISALPVSLGPIAEDLRAPATAAATALLIYSLFVAAFVMLGAKIGSLAGERLVLQVCVVVHGVAMALMALSTSARAMNLAQAIAGIATTALSWRYSYWLIVLLAVAVFILSFRLAPVARQRDVRIDIIGVVVRSVRPFS